MSNSLNDLPWYEQVSIRLLTVIFFIPIMVVLLVPTLILGLGMIVYSKWFDDC